MKAAGGAALPRPPGGSLGARDRRRRRSAAPCTTLYLRRQLIDLGEGVVNSAFGGDVDETALQQIERAEKKLYDLASSGQTEGGFKPFRAALTEATVRGRGGLSPGRPAHRRGHRPVPARPAAGRPAQVGPDHPGRPAVDGKKLARHQHRLQRRQGLSRGARRGRQAQGGRRRRGRLLLARNVGRAARHPHDLRAGRDAVGEDPQGRAASAPTSTSVLSVSHELEHLNFFIDDTPALSIAALAHPRPPAQAHARARPADHRLPPAARARPGKTRQENRVQEVSEITRGLKTLGQGARRAGAGAVAAQPRRRAARGQAAAARRPARIGLDRAGRRRRHVHLSRRVLPARARSRSAATDESDQRFNERHDAWKQRCEQTLRQGRGDRGQAAPRPDRHRAAGVRGPVHQVRQPAGRRRTGRAVPRSRSGRWRPPPTTTRRAAPARS